LVDDVLSLVEGAVKKANMDLAEINEVILSGGTSNTPKLAARIQQIFPSATTVLSPATYAAALNPSELSARGAAIQASLIAEYEKEDIEQSTHPAVTVSPHLSKPIGIVIKTKSSSDSEEASKEDKVYIFMDVETAVPAKRTAIFAPATEDGDILIRIVEAKKVTVDVTPAKVEKPKTNGISKEDGDDEDDEDDEDDDEDEEVEKVTKSVLEVDTVLAEALLPDVKRKQKVEVMLNVAGDLTLTVAARAIGGKGGVRGTVQGLSQ